MLPKLHWFLGQYHQTELLILLHPPIYKNFLQHVIINSVIDALSYRICLLTYDVSGAYVNGIEFNVLNHYLNYAFFGTSYSSSPNYTEFIIVLDYLGPSPLFIERLLKWINCDDTIGGFEELKY